MAETLTPNPTTNQRQRPPMAARVQSPTSPFFLGSNDDQLERAAARAARAAASRRKAVDVVPPRHSLSSSSALDREQIMELFHNCVKLASENKINQKNTWELKLIDHLSEIIKVEAEENAQTNFPKASCSLEAGVKIYAVRVDAWHADAYRVLSGISRAGLEDEQVEGHMIGNESDAGRPNEAERKVSPLSTLESSFEVLSVKKFDVAFAVDPLYQQTSAQFDEGGAKGLLLNNLGVYGRCRVLFDSEEVPGKGMLSANDSTSSDLIDISFARELIDLMVMSINKVQEISPSLRDIMEQFDQCSLPSRIVGGLDSNFIENTQQNNDFSSSDAAEDMKDQCNDGPCDDAEAWFPDHHDNATVCDEEGVSFMSEELDTEDGLKNFASPFYVGFGRISMQNAWAGPDHWKYRKPKGPANVSAPDGIDVLDHAAKRPKDKKSLELDIDFTSHLDEEVSDMFAPAKNPKSLLLPPRKVSYSNTLPEDCHYQPEDLLKLFLLPNIMCIGKPRKKVSGSDLWQQGNYCDGPSPSWDDESAVSGQYDDGLANSDVEQDTLISQPRQVNRIEVQYDKTSKQVDVHMLKETLWNHMQMQESLWTPEMKTTHKDGVSFRHILATFPDDCNAAATHDDLSPHLCFMCILHLANEHGLTIQGCPDLDDLCIQLPPAFQNTGEVIQSSPP